MSNLIHHHRFHVPNSLAIFAAVLLLVTSVVGYETSQETFSSGKELTISIKADTNTSDVVSDSAEPTRRGLNLGSLLFPRG